MSLKLKITIIAFCLLILAGVSLLGVVFHTVTRDTENRIERGAIDRVIASESPVFYDDGITPIGVFFDKTHRKYIHFDQIPTVFVNALLAAEDSDFFDHGGFDLKAIVRALLANVRAGKVVQGGSTITQQTAKNIFRRERRSFKAKLKELFQAFMLERRYGKEEILEMYVNQFFVTGYGKGLRIAAQYFFDKDAEDLDLVEAAFIAGCVKGPNRYNPFIKRSAAEKQRARVLAGRRKDYVIDRMLQMGFIDPERHDAARARQVPFKEGKITYRLNVILDFIREQLESEYFQSVLREQGVENIAASGISIRTAVNREIEEAALSSLRTHLPRLDVELEGYPEGRAEIHDDILGASPEKTEGALPFVARVTGIQTNGNGGILRVAWDGADGIVSFDGYKDMGQAWLRWRTGKSTVFDHKQAARFLKIFHEGNAVAVVAATLEKDTEQDAPPNLRLTSIPELQGAVVVVQNGMIKAMAGGFFNRFFNRATEAKRQLGSIFKPLVYAAALQLKWNSLDPLQNIDDIFRFEGTYYLPRPDHSPRSREVSMTFAGAKSENLATVWLLYHLTDQLNMSEFRELTKLVGLSREKGEAYPEYRKRIRDTHGVVVGREALMEAAFEAAKREAVSDIIFSGEEDMLTNLKLLHYRPDAAWAEAGAADERDILYFDFGKIRESKLDMEARVRKAHTLLRRNGPLTAFQDREAIGESLKHFYRAAGEGPGVRICYAENSDSLPDVPTLPITPEEFISGALILKAEDIWIDGRFVAHMLDLIQENTARQYEKLQAIEPYEPECLFRIRDFRTLVGLKYVATLSERLGISTKLDPVLSFPLGPNAVSILEAALAYQAMLTAERHTLGSKDDGLLTPIITRILDREGEPIWEYRSEPRPVLSERIAVSIGEILRQVMARGTGRRARDAVKILGVPIPTFGKTGTANRFTNSSFVGHVPGPDPDKGRLDTREGYTIAVYVGYDDNRPMKTDHFAIYGASGALPLWTDTANGIVNSNAYLKRLQLADLAFESPEPASFAVRAQFAEVPVLPISGLPAAQPDGSLPRVLGDGAYHGGKWRPVRTFEPVKGAPE
ncbi:MAG: transglycosylase domain-containing protein [Deltaproteobacteria bacterium]|nr:transglycosylase domain-containing protein [Deltaproteobacteria bacterium]